MVHIPGVTSFNQVFHVLDCTIWGVDCLIIGNVVAHINLGAVEHGRYPNGIDSEVLEVINLAYDAGDISQPVSVGVLEGGRVNLIANCIFPPRSGGFVCGPHDSQKRGGAAVWWCSRFT